MASRLLYVGLFVALLVLVGGRPKPEVVDFADPTYGSIVRQLVKTDGQEHNMYVHRSPFNADNSYLLGIRAAPNGAQWKLVLYDGLGYFQRELFAVDDGWNWRVTWDRADWRVFYLQDGENSLFSYNIETATLSLLKQFDATTAFVAGSEPSLNQDGTRVLVYTYTAGVRPAPATVAARSYRLSDMEEERAFDPASILPPNARTAGTAPPRYTGFQDHIAIAWLDAIDATIGGVLVYDEVTGTVIHNFIGEPWASGHLDFSSDGRMAYRKWGAGLYFTTYHTSDHQDLEIHVVNVNGTNDQIVFRATEAEAWWVQNLHVVWPARVTDWFLVGFYPPAFLGLPTVYAAPYDEILQVYTDERPSRYLTRTGTKSFGPPLQGWAQPLPAPSPDGTRVSFNAVCDLDNVGALGCTPTGTIDQYVLPVYPRRGL